MDNVDSFMFSYQYYNCFILFDFDALFWWWRVGVDDNVKSDI